MRARVSLLTFGLAVVLLVASTGAPAAAASIVTNEIAAPVPAEAQPTPKEAPAAALFTDMKHVWQSINNCGPAAVVMALSTMGIDQNQEVARLALRGPDERRGMGPQGVGPWVQQLYGLRSTWRNDGTNDLMKRLIGHRLRGL